MANIITNTFLTGADKGLELANLDYVRRFSWGNNWNRIRIGAVLTITPNGTSNITNTDFAFGLCSGTTKPWNSTPDNWVGFRSPTGSGLGTYQYIANSGDPVYSFTTFGKMTSYQLGVENAFTNLSVVGVVQTKPNNIATPKRSCLILEIPKGSPSYSFFLWCQQTSGHGALDVPPWRFGQAMTQALGVVDAGLASSAGTQTVNASEVNGDLDCMNIFWNQASFPMQLHAMAAVRYY
jgi:hypothetical protein